MCGDPRKATSKRYTVNAADLNDLVCGMRSSARNVIPSTHLRRAVEHAVRRREHHVGAHQRAAAHVVAGGVADGDLARGGEGVGWGARAVHPVILGADNSRGDIGEIGEGISWAWETAARVRAAAGEREGEQRTPAAEVMARGSAARFRYGPRRGRGVWTVCCVLQGAADVTPVPCSRTPSCQP